MIGGSTQQKLFGDHSSTYSLVTKEQFLKHQHSEILDPSKIALWWLRSMCLSGLQKFFVGCYPFHVCLQASLGSYLNAETNGEAIRHFKQIISSQTSGDGNFLILILPCSTTHVTIKWWKHPKNATFHTFDGCKKFLVGCLTSWLRLKVALHPRELPEKIWGQYNKIKTP